ncbi:MAG: CBS domain-containing protein [Anaerolineae bacterium]|jgi:tRNA nucleotidyltransferase (CCA-adding enzyme)|nr:CBS domain-containing protein [Chloroflexota bacterium]
MKIITSHERADMDALASMYAASLLFPQHAVVLPQNLNRNLRDFVALYGDQLPFVERRNLQRGTVEEAILVDTQAIAPLRGMHHQTRILAIDHHGRNETLSAETTYQGEPLGATTSLLVERLMAQELHPSRIGASLMLIGIYEDTGALTYLTTTARDARAAAWLLDQGADLEIAAEFLRRPLSDLQRRTLASLVDAATIHHILDRTVCIAAIVLDQYVDELSSLIHELLDLYDPDACVLLAEYQGSVQMIARSVTDAIDVAEVLRPLGGGGHSKAAAGRAENVALNTVIAQLLEQFRANIRPPVRVREIMSINVHTLSGDMTVQGAAQLMRRYGHEGFPVVQGDQLIGMLTRSDVDRALHHQRGDSSVRTILYTGPVAVSPDASVNRVQEIMLEHGLGQVPVVEDGAFVGIVTRTDLIKLYSPATATGSQAEAVRTRLAQDLPEELNALLLQARDAANDLGYSLYVVGGFVRDLLLHHATPDLDLVVEGDAERLARRLAARVQGQVRTHARFGTAKVLLTGALPAGVPPSLDFVTARTEFYESPTVLPQVERSSIKQDLYRRDFTINTMAICLDRERFGELLDYYGGLRDLEERRIRVLHNLSFVEDPTRILRAVRFEQRLGFEIESRTYGLMQDALDLLENVSGERLRNELFLILREQEPEKSLQRLDQLGALARIHPSLRFNSDLGERFARLRLHRAELARNGDAPQGEIPELRRSYLALLSGHLSAEELAALAHRLRLTNDDAAFLRQVVQLQMVTASLVAERMLPSSIYAELHPFSAEARFVLLVLTDSARVRERVTCYEKELARVSPALTGNDLKAMGVPPGPVYRVILDRVRDALLDHQISSIEEQLALARALADAAAPTH